MNSTPIISARIIRLTALLPPPPTPMTRMSAKFSESDRSGIAYPPGGSPAEVVVRSGPPEMCVEEARDGAGSDADSIPRNRPRSPAARALKPLSGDLSTSRSRPWRSATSAREKAEAHFPDRVVGVRIEQCDRLPRPESEPAGDHGYCQRGRGQERQDVVGAVALRAVAVHPAVVPREHPVEARHQVGLRPGAEFHDDQTGGMRHEHGEKPTSLTGDEPGALLGQVVQASLPPRPDRQLGRLHLREEAPYRVANTGKTPHRRRRLKPGRLARRKTPGAPVEQAYGGAVGRIHDVVGQTQDARGTGHADRHVQDLTSQGRGAGQLARSAGEDHASRQEAVARRTDLGPQHLEVLAHARLDDPADLEAAHRPAGGLAQHRDADRFVVGDCLEGARAVHDLEILGHLEARLEADGHVIGDVDAADRQNRRLERRTVEEEREVDGAGAHIGHGHAQLALGIRQDGFGRSERGGDRLVDLYVCRQDAFGQIAHGRGGSRDDVSLDLQADGAHPQRILDAFLAIDDVAAWDDVQDFAVRRDGHRPRDLHRPADVLASHFAVVAAHRDRATRVLAFDVLTAYGPVCQLDLITRQPFGVLDGIRDRSGRLLDVDHDGLLQPAGRHHALADDGQVAIPAQLADESADLARPDVDPDEHIFAFHSLTSPLSELPVYRKCLRISDTFWKIRSPNTIEATRYSSRPSLSPMNTSSTATTVLVTKPLTKMRLSYAPSSSARTAPRTESRAARIATPE